MVVVEDGLCAVYTSYPRLAESTVVPARTAGISVCQYVRWTPVPSYPTPPAVTPEGSRSPAPGAEESTSPKFCHEGPTVYCGST